MTGLTVIAAYNAADRFNGILPPPVPGPYYVMPSMMPISGFHQPRSDMIPTWDGSNLPAYHYPAPYFFNRQNNAATLPAQDNAMTTNRPHSLTD